MRNIPDDIIDIIILFYIPLFMSRMKNIHEELIHDSPILALTEDILDFELDFLYATRLPALEPQP